MPQIFPMNWIILSLIMIMTITLTVMNIYFFNFSTKDMKKMTNKVNYEFSYKF
uniref:ATP synthase subunit 8 n=1 Tax=Rhipicephalus kohlsi TaxID=127004 RepID=V9MMB1_9ACAR|nr:ATP synthase subunit 8 [Rhipicephalus kohlsi]